MKKNKEKQKELTSFSQKTNSNYNSRKQTNETPEIINLWHTQIVKNESIFSEEGH